MWMKFWKSVRVDQCGLICEFQSVHCRYDASGARQKIKDVHHIKEMCTAGISSALMYQPLYVKLMIL